MTTIKLYEKLLARKTLVADCLIALKLRASYCNTLSPKRLYLYLLTDATACSTKSVVKDKLFIA